jgi:hypothetical protein
MEAVFIEDLVLGKQIKTHVHNLRPFLFNPQRVNPQEVAQKNEQEFMVNALQQLCTSYREMSRPTSRANQAFTSS